MTGRDEDEHERLIEDAIADRERATSSLLAAIAQKAGVDADIIRDYLFAQMAWRALTSRDDGRE